ncbi:MAG: IS1634 family transposase [Chitinophagales bacterium]|nr:IS1634 family transposase [Chitinophagales bacterium]MCZ2223353.1 IS1634 family transposase [Chitinophagales bacterium]MCZ2223742.1 IS1634 family transposase [Chitinophagales bacterium]
MYKIRLVKYSVNSVSIQVYIIENRKRKIIKHIGTAKNEDEKEKLIQLAQDYINKVSKQLHIFEKTENKIIDLTQMQYIGVYYTFFYEVMHKLFISIGFDKHKNNLLLDLVIIRLFEPASKFQSIKLIEQYFGIKYRRQGYYESAPKWLDLKEQTERITIKFAKENYEFKYDLLFYDVTTLYFETFEEDELRKNGFSKDSKSQQPQILVALMVTKEGFPIAYEIFSGNTFEGHTFIPSIQKFIAKNKVKDFTIVADAAMISDDNIQELIANNLHYIVGARLGNVPRQLFDKIDTMMIREDGQTIRIPTKKGFLVCSYSSVRYRKDKYEMEKQLRKAELLVANPSKNKKAKFIKAIGRDKVEINKGLIDKTKKLLGIKGYYTNMDESQSSNTLIIERYHELYKIEQNFRIAKNDLETRPIFHFKEEPIKLHVLICFMALAVSRKIELSTGASIRSFIQECKKITDARLLNLITKEEIKMRSALSPKMSEFLAKLNLLT